MAAPKYAPRAANPETDKPVRSLFHGRPSARHGHYVKSSAPNTERWSLPLTIPRRDERCRARRRLQVDRSNFISEDGFAVSSGPSATVGIDSRLRFAPPGSYGFATDQAF